MIHGPARHARLTATLAAAVLALITAASACAQPGGGGAASQGGGRAIPSPDSVLARSHRSREKGAASATLTVIEISDFQCPYCRQFYEQTYRAFDSAYVKTGKVRMTFIHFPLSIHSQAYPASKAAACAGAQGKFWEMHDRLFSTQREWSGQADATQRFARFAMDLGLDPAAEGPLLRRGRRDLGARRARPPRVRRDGDRPRRGGRSDARALARGAGPLARRDRAAGGP